MLNENDFTEIGKRIYDLEADPPLEGWNKIAGGLKHHPGNRGFFSRNWWKPLIIIIPVIIWFAFHQDILSSEDLSSNLKQEGLTVKKHSPNSSENAAQNSPAGTAGPAMDQQEKFAGVGDASDLNKVSVAKDKKTGPAVGKDHLPRPGNDASVHVIDHVISGETAGEPKSISGPITLEHSLVPSTHTRTREMDATAISEALIEADSLQKQDKDLMMGAAETGDVADEEKERDLKTKWRLTTAFVPQYLMKSVRPVMNDEVVITRMEDRKTFEHLGFSVAMGVGKQIRENLFIDATAIFISQKEKLAYSYTTGKVDTLIARQNEDGSVRIIPVYAATSAEISSKLNYGGIRLGATYYFWGRGKTRFNVSAAGGANVLLYSDIKESLSGESTHSETDRPAKSMYTLSFGAGYNVRLGESWELQVNPSLTYYSGKSNRYQQILNLNQRSYGVSIMISRFF